MGRRVEKNKYLREVVDACNEFIAVRDEFWSLGVFDKLLRPGRCAAVLTRYETTRARMRAALRQAVKNADTAALDNRLADGAAGGLNAEKTSVSWSGEILSMEEIKMLLDKPAS